MTNIEYFKLALSKDFLDIHGTMESGFTLKTRT